VQACVGNSAGTGDGAGALDIMRGQGRRRAGVVCDLGIWGGEVSLGLGVGCILCTCPGVGFGVVVKEGVGRLS
jgi:hypothetical protein